MANNGTPTFKLVLVGDGGTGKVRRQSSLAPTGQTALATSRDSREQQSSKQHLATGTRTYRALDAQIKTY